MAKNPMERPTYHKEIGGPLPKMRLAANSASLASHKSFILAVRVRKKGGQRGVISKDAAVIKIAGQQPAKPKCPNRC
jgi:hypothetical protein